MFVVIKIFMHLLYLSKHFYDSLFLGKSTKLGVWIVHSVCMCTIL